MKWASLKYGIEFPNELHYPQLVWYWLEDEFADASLSFDSVESSNISNVRDVQPNEVHYVHRSPWGSDQLQPKQQNQLAR